MDYPGAPDLDEHRSKAESLWDLGIRTFVNLVEENETNNSGKPFCRYDDLLRQLAAESAEQVARLRFPIKDLGVPSADRMRSILDAIDLSLVAGRPVYVHCFGGVGRTGTAVCCWIIRHGWTETQNAIDLLAVLRKADAVTAQRPASENSGQREFVLAWKAGA